MPICTFCYWDAVDQGWYQPPSTGWFGDKARRFYRYFKGYYQSDRTKLGHSFFYSNSSSWKGFEYFVCNYTFRSSTSSSNLPRKSPHKSTVMPTRQSSNVSSPRWTTTRTKFTPLKKWGIIHAIHNFQSKTTLAHIWSRVASSKWVPVLKRTSRQLW